MADLEPDTRNVLLTFAQIWHSVATGEITSKDAAAVWAADRLEEPERNIVLSAREQYIGGTHGDWRESDGRRRSAVGWARYGTLTVMNCPAELTLITPPQLRMRTDAWIVPQRRDVLDAAVGDPGAAWRSDPPARTAPAVGDHWRPS